MTLVAVLTWFASSTEPKARLVLALPVRVTWTKKCRNRPEEHLERSVSEVRTRANVRLLAAALRITGASDS